MYVQNTSIELWVRFNKESNKIKNLIKNPLKTGPAMAGPDGQVATALCICVYFVA